MTAARVSQVNTDVTRYYHCVSRCVRQAYLCGYDEATQRNYAHRREWIVARLGVLAEVFTIKILAYAVMHNHVHLVLYVDLDANKELTDTEIIARVSLIFPKTFHRPICVNSPAFKAKMLKRWRKRLADLSWFMRCLNEHIARKANFEDRCKGKFWEGRFRSQALLDEAALLSCLSYVDLNPVRAGMAKGLEDSDFTSIKQRLMEIAAVKRQHISNFPQASSNRLVSYSKQGKKFARKTPRLAPMLLNDNCIDDVSLRAKLQAEVIIPLSLANYLELLDWTGRAILENKRGYITAPAPKILAEIGDTGVSVNSWIHSATKFEDFSVLVGSLENRRKYATHFKNRQYAKGRYVLRDLHRKVI